MPKNLNDGVSIHAGFPNPAADATLEGLTVNQLLVPRPVSTFFLRVKGELWEDRGIFNDDIAVVDRALEPRLADWIICWEEDTFTICRLSTMPDNKETWGVVTAIIHRYRTFP